MMVKNNKYKICIGEKIPKKLTTLCSLNVNVI